MPDTDVLDSAAVGQALMKLAMISKQLGHGSVARTAKDYLLPHDLERTAEQWFILTLIVNGPDAVISDEQIASMVANLDLPAIKA
jgi:hypothetical protein